MTNRIIAAHFRELANLMELLEENPFKIRSYRNAYQKLRNFEEDLFEMDQKELEAIPGVGKAISAKIVELKDSGKMATLEKVREKIPEGVVEMLGIKGLGPGRIGKLWKGLEIQSPGELLYACEENRLVDLKGFGKKSQEDIGKKVQYFLSQKGLFFYHDLEEKAAKIVNDLKGALPDEQFDFTGELRRKMNTLRAIELLTTAKKEVLIDLGKEDFKLEKVSGEQLEFSTDEGIPVLMYTCSAADWGSSQIQRTGPKAFIERYLEESADSISEFETELQVFESIGKPFIIPEHRDWPSPGKAANLEAEELVREEQIKGVVHAHSTYSDGAHSLEKMAEACKREGFEYLAISDHSAFASYAGGLTEKEVLKQWEEIDHLNKKFTDFRIIKGIEADILPDGNMDYDPELLGGFELVIASIHSVLNMDEKRATDRLIKAIENPHTHMLGHPSGRLLLSRPAYPLQMEKITDACVANGVAIEINANPHRLDLDWSFVFDAQEKGVKFSINPDAHSVEGIGDIRHGVRAARKGGMLSRSCLNTLSADEFLAAFKL